MKDGRNERQGRGRNYSGAVVESEPSGPDSPSGFALDAGKAQLAAVTYKIVPRL